MESHTKTLISTGNKAKNKQKQNKFVVCFFKFKFVNW